MTTPIHMSADKSRLLAYLKHTPGFQHRLQEFRNLTVTEILTCVRQADEPAYRTCITRFRQNGIQLEPQREQPEYSEIPK